MRLILVALVAFEEFRRVPLSGRTAGLIFWVSAALAVLAKGPVGLLLPLGTAILTLAFDRSLREWKSFAPLLGLAAFAAVAGAWLLALWIWPVEGYSVLGSLREHFVERGLTGMHHVQPAWYYATVLPWALFPWSFLLPAALVVAWRARKRPGITLLLVHSLFVVGFFSISSEKRDLDVLPALHTFAVLIALAVGGILWSRQEAWSVDRPVLGSRWLRLPQGVAAGVFVLAGVAGAFVA